MKKLPIQLLVTASILGLTALAHAQDNNSVKLPEPLAGAAELFKTAPTIAVEAAEKAGEMATDAVKAAGDAAEETAEKAADTATDAMKTAKDTADTIKVPEPLPGASDLSKTPPTIAEEKPEMAEEKTAETMSAMEHTIVAGDTLWDIAKSKLGDATKYPAIVEANPGINPHNLKIGTGLKLPAK